MAGLNILYQRTLMVLWLASGTMGLYAQEESLEDYRVKAVYLYNFTQFVEWPPAAFPGHDAPLVVGILGDDPFGTYLEEVVDGEQINGHALSIRRFAPEEEIKDCHVLFINLLDPEQITQTLARLKGRSILTVSDRTGFLKAGGMIEFMSVDNKMQFRINPDAASAADLKISSKLLRVAEVVTLPIK
jgi:hypothetical protein